VIQLCRMVGCIVPASDPSPAPTPPSLAICQARASPGVLLTASAFVFNGACASMGADLVPDPASTTPPRPVDETKAGPLHTHNLTLALPHRGPVCPTPLTTPSLALPVAPFPRTFFCPSYLSRCWPHVSASPRFPPASRGQQPPGLTRRARVRGRTPNGQI
jgi:hypothetical protein